MVFVCLRRTTLCTEGPPTAMQYWVYVTLKFNINAWIFAGAVKPHLQENHHVCQTSGFYKWEHVATTLDCRYLLVYSGWVVDKDGLARYCYNGNFLCQFEMKFVQI